MLPPEDDELYYLEPEPGNLSIPPGCIPAGP
jgi:hypothetical protein